MVQPGPPRAVWGLLLAGALLLGAGEAQARTRLSVARAEQAGSCPDTAQLTAQVEAVLGRPALSASSDSAPELAFNVEVFPDGDGFGAIVRVTGSKQGQRALHDAGPGCAGLGEALAVTIAMLLDDHEPLERPEPPRPPAPEPPRPPTPTEPPPARTETSLRARLGAGLSAGLTPEAGAMAQAGLSLLVDRRFSLGLEGLWVPKSRIDLPPGNVEVGLFAARLKGCWLPVSGPLFALSGCVEATGGAFRAEGTSYAITRVAWPGWAAVGLGVEAGGAFGREGALGRLGWFLAVDGLVSLREQAFLVHDVGVTPPLSRAGMTAGGGLSITIW